MKPWLTGLMGAALLAGVLGVASSGAQPPRGEVPPDRQGEKEPPPPPRGEGRRGGPGGGPGFPGGPGGGPPPFQLGRVLPPFAHEEIDLSEEQLKAIRGLEQEVKAKLQKILTPEQVKRLESLRPRGFPGGPGGPGGFPGGPGGPGGRGGFPGGPGGPGEPGGGPPDKPRRGGADKPDKPRPDRPGRPDQGNEPVKAGGISWFAVWEEARAEAARTGKPILLVSAAPHCAGVPGIW